MERNNIALHKELQKQHNINQYNKSLKAPYEYFKKLNILPVSLVEGELDKYFTFEELLFEDFKDYNCIGNKNYSWPYTWLCPIFYQNLYNSVKTYFNYNDAKIEYCESKNIPQELITLYNFKSYFAPIQMLWKVISENIKDDFKSDLIYNYNTNIKNLNKTIEELANKQKGYIKVQKYLIPLDKIPPYSQLELEGDYGHSYDYHNIVILKVCNKIIKYFPIGDASISINQLLDFYRLKQVKKDMLLWYMKNNCYKVKDYDCGKYYIYENGEVKLED
jgi:hypothetical protein